jgi:Kelch motif
MHAADYATPMLRAVVLLLVLAACSSPSPSATQPESSPPPSTEPGEPSPTGSAPATSPSASTVASATWEVLDDAPFARLEMAVGVHDDRIWLAGGLSPLGGALTDVEAFDPALGEWSDGPSLPSGVHHSALVSDGERLLLVGGYLGDDFSRPTDIVLELTDGAGSWAEGPALPVPRAAGAAAFDGSRVVYAGGVSPGGGIHADVFTLEGGAWQRLGSMRNTREHLAATSDGEGTVWLMGGRVGGLDSNLAIVETVVGDQIDQLPDLPTPRGGVAAFYAEAHGGCLTGGEAPDQAYTVVECVAADGTVTTLAALNEPHHGHGAAVVDGLAYVLLGGPQPTLSADSTVEALTLTP